MQSKKILITGGAGYIGSVLAGILMSAGHRVRVLDNLSFGGESIVDLINEERFEFLKGDVRDKAIVKEAMKDMDAVVHLAAIVGDPACAQDPELARAINLDASRDVFSIASDVGVDRFVFASTCSNYGKMENPDAFVTEESELRPVSLYAETKVAFEQFLLEFGAQSGTSPTVLRFSTVYGLSRRIRFDLTVNEFTRELALGRELVVFGEQFWRPYCHVYDLARSVVNVLGQEKERVRGEVFNVGDTRENYQKKMIVDEILKQIPEGKVKYVTKNEDPRDYRVDFGKIREKLGFQITRTVPDGIRDIRKVLQEGFLPDPDSAYFRNI